MNIFQKLGLKHPVIQGGMANIATSDFAAVVTNCGALGIIGTGGWDVVKAEKEIVNMKKLVGDKSFGVNVMLLNPHASDIIDCCIKHNVKIVTTGAGNPGKYIDKLHAANILVAPVVPSLALAKKMQKLGCDAVIAEGTESGGHVGELTTMTLTYNLAHNLEIDVIAAGGISSKEQFCAALSLGAVGVQIGTVLLATHECPIHENYKLAVVNAKDSSTIVTGRLKGAPVRSIKNAMAREYLKLEQTDISMDELEMLSLGSLRRAVFDGDKDKGSFMAGQVAGSIKEIKSVNEVICELTDYDTVLEKLVKMQAQIKEM